uniref:Putative secreted protein n=1 Tax=Anopheles darlingi TaxID=43151 RepID=A0A2M4DF89_ANODA
MGPDSFASCLLFCSSATQLWFVVASGELVGFNGAGSGSAVDFGIVSAVGAGAGAGTGTGSGSAVRATSFKVDDAGSGVDTDVSGQQLVALA